MHHAKFKNKYDTYEYKLYLEILTIAVQEKNKECLIS